MQDNAVTTVPLTIHSFPSLEPRSLESWSTKHLYLPLRRDILHLAVYMLWRGGGKSHGPRPRDFSTKLNRKVYDLAWRTALSYRYRRGELIVTEDGLELPLPDEFLQLAESGRLGRELEDSFVSKYVSELMATLQWDKTHGRTTFITGDRRPNLFTGMDIAGENGRALELEDVDVKDLLETGRIVIERGALREMIKAHSSDLVSRVVVNGLKSRPALGTVLVQ
ncbi:54S ribosomal protein yml6, mitochondrial [Collariella sp. IMI 366227]|nr:54S ribosomal protein yml6, mitochondrial [Collariella sp. IMI 366227]